MNQHKLLIGMVIASFLIPSISFATIQTNALAVAAPVKIIKVASGKSFYSEAGRFSINFPTPPTISREKDKKGIIAIFFKADNGQAGYDMVAYSDIPPIRYLSPTELKKALTEITASYPKSSGIQILDAKYIQIGNSIGREFKFKQANKVGLGQIRIVAERVYCLMSLSDSPKKQSAFLNSFRLR